jgi:hypothetical protein
MRATLALAPRLASSALANKAPERLVQFTKDRHGQRNGVLVATPRGVGWSALHPRDKFDRELALRIAEGRVINGSNAHMPDRIRRVLPTFWARAQKIYGW